MVLRFSRTDGPVTDYRTIEDTDRWAPRPECCIEAALIRDESTQGVGGDIDRPFVRLSEDGSHWRVGWFKASWCPFCGKALPQVELDPHAKGPFRDFDQYGRCRTCGGRFCDRECLPGSARFRIKKP